MTRVLIEDHVMMGSIQKGGGDSVMRVAVLISGRGSNLRALLATKQESFCISLVLANTLGAEGLRYAEEYGVSTVVVDHRQRTRQEFEEDIQRHLEEHRIQFICLAGFMRILSDGFVRKWSERILNIHPSLLPDFEGLHVHERVLDSGQEQTGCTVHFVRSEVDRGPILLQAAVDVYATDDPSILAERVLRQEHILYPLALRVLTKQGLVQDLIAYKERIHEEGGYVEKEIGGIAVILMRSKPSGPFLFIEKPYLFLDTLEVFLKRSILYLLSQHSSSGREQEEDEYGSTVRGYI